MFRRRRLAKSLREYDLQPAADFLFERRPYEVRCADRKPGRREIDEGQTRAVLVAGNQAPYLLTRLDELRLSRADVPVLTVTADPSNCVAVAGSSRPDWSLHFCAQGEGETEDDARKRLQQISMARAGGTVLLTGPHLLSAEARDAYTKNHCERLARYATALGKELGLAKESLESLYRGGYLHDLGKIGVPDNILLKPSGLTSDEYARMKEHTVIGDMLCAEMRSLAHVRPIVRHHHERLDGSGYPDGLRGDAIALTAQIMSIVDIFDALTTTRPYRPALPLEHACEELTEEAHRGWRRLDLVERFIALASTGRLVSAASEL